MAKIALELTPFIKSSVKYAQMSMAKKSIKYEKIDWTGVRNISVIEINMLI